ncbi:MAG: winged helix-turn-helix transcriptional regulator, partial [Oscillospiraceae bacterium]
DMEDSQLISRKVYPEVPSRVEYSLSEKGRAMFPILLELRRWGMINNEDCGQDCDSCQRCMPKNT